MTMRPSFSAAWAASLHIHDPVNGAAKVARVIGGAVAANILPPGAPGKWSNTSAVRLSYILNQTGMPIPRTPGQTVSGADHRWYFHRIRDVIQFLRQRWGEPDVVAAFWRGGASELNGMQGLLLFEAESGANEAGYATLWNGAVCLERGHFNEAGVQYRAPSVNFWSLL
jgi:hypothetical protein